MTSEYMNNHQPLLLGIDGGASKTILRLEDSAGNLLGEVTTGPANIQLDCKRAWQSILEGLNQLKSAAGSPIYAVAGVAGTEVPEALATFLATPHPFAKLTVLSDAELACVAAHGGKDGGIVVAGTGMIALKRVQGQVKRISGWGFPHDDEGGGAWLGLQAVRATLQWLDGRAEPSALAEAVHGHFKCSQAQLVTWATQANATAYATLAPLVVQAAGEGDGAAILLLKQAAHIVETLIMRLDLADLPMALMGGLACYLQPYLSPMLQGKLTQSLLSPQAGAVLLARRVP